MALNEKQFYSSGQARWERLGALCKRAENSPRALKGAELTEFINLYRQTCSDLAVVDTDDADARSAFLAEVQRLGEAGARQAQMTH